MLISYVTAIFKADRQFILLEKKQLQCLRFDLKQSNFYLKGIPFPLFLPL